MSYQQDNNFVIDDEPTDTSYNNNNGGAGTFENEPYDDLPPPEDDVPQDQYHYPPEDEQDYQQQQQPEQPRSSERDHKYSTANMNEDGKCKKYLSICALFLLFLAFMIGLSLLFNHLFFSDESDNGESIDQRPVNSTFPKDKQDIDAACSRSTYRQSPDLCEEACVPQYFKCCDPFDEFDLYNFTETNTNSTTEELSSITELEEKNYTFFEGYENWEPDSGACSFETDLRGCVSYAKCHVIAGQLDAAPANLPALCSFETLEKDPQGCQSLCQPLKCCYSNDSDNCLAEKFDLCMDYAPCQNLRTVEGTTVNVLETAPHTLDFDCYWQQPECTETCAKAESCGDSSSFALQSNFISCLTYSPCNGVTETEIQVAPQFNTVSQPPNDIIYACDPDNEEPTEKTCVEYCTEAACCWKDNKDDNCFFEDPLGCLAWEAQCL